jgi:hypothetical protein
LRWADRSSVSTIEEAKIVIQEVYLNPRNSAPAKEINCKGQIYISVFFVCANLNTKQRSMRLDCNALLVLLSRHKRLGVLFMNNSRGSSVFWRILCHNNKAIFWTKLSDVNNGYKSDDFFLGIRKENTLCV